MVNSLNINHSQDEIMPSSEGLLFVKQDDIWNDISNKNLYKSEFYIPTNDFGNDGDYFAKYIRRYNYIKFSENFNNTKYWTPYELSINKDPEIIFPYTASSKLIPSKINNEHSLTYYFNNDLTSKQTPYTFSLFVQPNEMNRIALAFLDSNEQYGFRVIFNTITNTHTLSNIGTPPEGEIININHDMTAYDDGYVRIWITAQFKTTLIIKTRINVVNNQNQIVFANTNTTDGLFINGAQLTKSSEPGKYTDTNNSYSTFTELEMLYTKNSDEWIELPDNKVIYFADLPKDREGNNDDIACQDALVELSPIVKFGSSQNIKNKPEGIIFYSEKKDTYYVKSKRGLYTLEFENAKPNNYGPSMAMTLSNKTYQTWCKSTMPSKFDYRIGYNTGGNTNFWSRISIRSRY